MNAEVKGVPKLMKFMITCEDGTVLYEYGKSFEAVRKHVEENFNMKVKRISPIC